MNLAKIVKKKIIETIAQNKKSLLYDVIPVSVQTISNIIQQAMSTNPTRPNNNVLRYDKNKIFLYESKVLIPYIFILSVCSRNF